MEKVTITTDKELIAKILNHPKVYKWITDDCSPKICEPIIHPGVIYLTDETQKWVIRIDPVNGICCQVHTTLLPEVWGLGIKIVKESIKWGFTNTKYMKIITTIPVFNRLAIKLTKDCGFKKEGLIKESFLKNWKLYDQEIWGLTKKQFYEEGELCQEQ